MLFEAPPALGAGGTAVPWDAEAVPGVPVVNRVVRAEELATVTRMSLELDESVADVDDVAFRMVIEYSVSEGVDEAEMVSLDMDAELEVGQGVSVGGDMVLDFSDAEGVAPMLG